MAAASDGLQAGKTDRVLRGATAVVVLAVATFAAAVSYSHIDSLGRKFGESGAAVRLLPFSVDGLILAASLVLLHEARNGRQAPALGRAMLWLGIAATIGANIAYGVDYGPLGAIIAAWPAVAFIGSAEMAMGMVRRARLGGREAAPAAAASVSVPRPRATVDPVTTSERSVADNATPDDKPSMPDLAPVAPRPLPRVPQSVATVQSQTPNIEAVTVFADLLAKGQVPSLREVRSEMHCRTDKARDIREYLKTVASASAA